MSLAQDALGEDSVRKNYLILLDNLEKPKTFGYVDDCYDI